MFRRLELNNLFNHLVIFLENEWSILILYSGLNLYLSRGFNTFYSAIIMRIEKQKRVLRGAW